MAGIIRDIIGEIARAIGEIALILIYLCIFHDVVLANYELFDHLMAEDHTLCLRLELLLSFVRIQPCKFLQDLHYLAGLRLVCAVGKHCLADVGFAGKEKIVHDAN